MSHSNLDQPTQEKVEEYLKFENLQPLEKNHLRLLPQQLLRVDDTPIELYRAGKKTLIISKSGTNIKDYLEAARL